VEIPISMLYAIFTSLVLYSAKWYHDHQVITDLKQSKIDKEKRIKHIEDEIIKIIEALERTYPTSSYLYDKFYDKDDLDMKLEHLKELVLKKQKVCKL